VPYAPNRLLHLRAYDTVGRPLSAGYFTIRDGETTRYLPLLNGADNQTAVEQSQVAIGFNAPDGTVVTAARWFGLVGEGSHTIHLNAPPAVSYQPNLVAPGDSFVGQTQSLTLTTAVPYSGTVSWYVNGEKQSATNTVFMPTFATAGGKSIVAILDDTHEQVSVVLEVQSYTHVTLDSLVPNPISPATEEVVLRNNNPFPVVLQGWQLRSQTSTSSVTISVVILANSTATIPSSNKLLNGGGAYSLYNDASQVVDAVQYGVAPSGERLTRDQTRWSFPSDADADPAVTSSPVSMTAVVEYLTGQKGETSPVTIAPAPARQADVVVQPRLAVHSASSLLVPELVLPYNRVMRWWISLLFALGGALILSSWPKKPV
jgi:hypothetical protein